MLDDVDGLDSARCERLGIAVVEPDEPQLVEAATERGSLSTQDHLCLIAAKADESTCTRNDAASRKACNEHDSMAFAASMNASTAVTTFR